MIPALPEAAPEDVVRAPRPAGLLTAAGAVPLGAAVLLAAGNLPGLARAVVGVAVVVLGAALLRTHGTVTAARMGRGIPTALGAIVVVGGVALAAGAVAGALDDPRGGALDGWGGVVLWVALAAAGLALLGAPGGTAGARDGLAEALLGAAGAVAVIALLAPGTLGAGATTRTVLVLVLASAATAAAATGRAGAGGPRVAGCFAAVLLAGVVGEATGVVALLTGGTVGPLGGAPRPGLQALQLAAALGLAGVLVAVAVARRDPATGLVAAGVLLLPRVAEDATAQLGLLVVPVAVVVGTAILAASAGARDAAGRVLGLADDPDAGAAADGLARPVTARAAQAALAVSAVVLGVAVVGAYRDEPRVAAAILLVATALALGAGWALRGRAGAIATAAGLAALVVAPPLVLLLPGGTGARPGLVAAACAVQAAVAVVVAAHTRQRGVLALAAVVVAGQATGAAAALAGSRVTEHLPWFLGVLLGIDAVALVVVAALALVGADAAVRSRQAIAAGLAFATALAAVGVARTVASGGGGAAAIDVGADRAVAVLLLAVLALGTTLLVATSARRPSVAVAVAGTLATVAVALYAGAVGAGVRSDSPAGDVRPVDALLGFDAVGSGLAGAAAGWPVLLGVVGAVLVALGWALESRRPLPADAPLGRAR